jgi:hypothetical protein
VLTTSTATGNGLRLLFSSASSHPRSVSRCTSRRSFVAAVRSVSAWSAPSGRPLARATYCPRARLTSRSAGTSSVKSRPLQRTSKVILLAVRQASQIPESLLKPNLQAPRTPVGRSPCWRIRARGRAARM